MSDKSIEISLIFDEINKTEISRHNVLEKKLDFIIKLIAYSKIEWYDWGIEDIFPEMKHLQEKVKE